MDHDEILKDCDIHLAYLGNGLFSEIKWKMRDYDFAQEPRTHKLANITTRVKPTSSVESMSIVTSEYVQTQNILTGTINIKCENNGTTSTTVIKSSTHGTCNISSASGTVGIFAGTPTKVVNIDPDTELVGTTILDKTKVTDNFSVGTTGRVMGSIDADASTLQLLVSENTRPKGADASCRKIGCDTHSPPPIDQNQYHTHATHGNTVVKDVQINLRRITDLDIDLWTASKPTTYLDDEKPKKQVHMQMLKGDIDTNDDNILTQLRRDKQTIKKSGKRSKTAISSTRPSVKPALVSRHGSKSTPILSSRTTRMQKIRYVAKSPAFKITVHGLKKFRQKYHYKCVVNPCAHRFSTVHDWNRHLHTFHQTILRCTVCRKGFKAPSTHHDHLYTHHEKQFTCNKCNKVFCYLSVLQAHMISHRRSRMYRCSAARCRSEYKYKQDLLRHVKQHD